MKKSRQVPTIYFQILLADAISQDVHVHSERARTLVSFFTTIEEFIEQPISRRHFLSVSGKPQTILTKQETKNVELFRRKLAKLKYPYEKLFAIMEKSRVADPEPKPSYEFETWHAPKSRIAALWAREIFCHLKIPLNQLFPRWLQRLIESCPNLNLYTVAASKPLKNTSQKSSEAK